MFSTNYMKKNIIALTILAVLIVGCTVARVTPADPVAGTPATTNYIVDPKLTQGLATAGAINAATAPVNPAYPLVEIGLGAIAAAAAWFAKRKNDQLAAQTLLTKTVVQSIDAQDNQTVKDAISAHAGKIGVEGELNTFVQKVGSGSI